MKIRLFSGNECVATKQLKTDSDYSRVAHASMLIFQTRHYRFQGVFDGAVNFEECDAPVTVDGFFERTTR